MRLSPDGETVAVADSPLEMPKSSHATEGGRPFRAKAGDWVVVHGHAVGEPSRSGLILEVLGTPGHERYRVRWDEEHESIFYPGSDATIQKAKP